MDFGWVEIVSLLVVVEIGIVGYKWIYFKVMIIDDCYLVIGFFNLSNCFMMFDIECDLIFVGDSDSNCE